MEVKNVGDDEKQEAKDVEGSFFILFSSFFL